MSRVFSIVVAAFAVVGCTEHHEPIRTETREVGVFEAIDMEGASTLEISVGPETSVQIEAAADVLERVMTEVRGGTLYIESRPKDWLPVDGRPRVSVRIAVPKLVSLRLGGGNDVQLHGFAGGESKIDVEGAAHIEGRGNLDRFTVHMAGAGHADFSELPAKDVHVTVEGVGSVIVHPEETLDATMNGVGAILYIGEPHEVSTRMNGLGRIAKRESQDAAGTDEHVEVDPDTPPREEQAAEQRQI